MKALPATAAELVRELDAGHPARCIGATEDPITAHRYAAKREMIDGLLRRLSQSVDSDPTQPLLKEGHF